MADAVTKTQLAAEGLANDPRIAEAKRLILDAIAEHSAPLAEVAPPIESLVVDYQALLDEYSSLRGGRVYFPYLGSGIGNGPFVELADGSVKLDLISGIGVHGYGHSHPKLIEAGIDAAICDTVMQGNLQANPSIVDTSRLLVDLAKESGSGINHCFLTTSGAMANENSLKLAFQKNTPANRIVAFTHCFAGRTLALAQLTDKAAYRQGLPDTIAVDYIPFFNEQSPERSTEIAVNHFKYYLNRHPGKYAAIWLELIQGEGGYYPGQTEFFRQLMTVARENGVAVIADEVQTFGRTSRPYAFQHFGLDDLVDIVTVGKITQVCATLFTDQYKPQPGLVSQTFTGSNMTILAANAILQGMIENGNFGDDGKNMSLHRHFASRLDDLSKKHPGCISGPFGLGGMIAFTAFDGSSKKTNELIDRLYAAGLMSFMAGGNPSRIRFLLPLGCAENSHIDVACDIIDEVVGKMAAER
jgi:acetylornithine aminotransferase